MVGFLFHQFNKELCSWSVSDIFKAVWQMWLAIKSPLLFLTLKGLHRKWFLGMAEQLKWRQQGKGCGTDITTRSGGFLVTNWLAHEQQMLRDISFFFLPILFKTHIFIFRPFSAAEWKWSINCFVWKERYKKKILMITHAKCQQLFDVMVSFVFFLGPGYFLKPCTRRRGN